MAAARGNLGGGFLVDKLDGAKPRTWRGVPPAPRWGVTGRPIQETKVASTTEKQLYTTARRSLAKQVNSIVKDGMPSQIVLSAIVDIALEVAIKSEKSGDGAAALQRLKDFLDLRFADLEPPAGGRGGH